MSRDRVEAAPVPVRFRQQALIYWWAVLAACVALSAYGNDKHAAMVVPEGFADEGQWIARLLPVFLLVVLEGLALGRRGGASGAMHGFGAAVVVVLAAIVFWGSYVGLLSVVRGTELFAGIPALEYAMALVPDVAMAAATGFIMSLRAKGPAVAEGGGALSRIGGNVMARIERATAVAPVDEATIHRAAPVVDRDPVEAIHSTIQVDREPAIQAIQVDDESAIQSTIHPDDEWIAQVSEVERADDEWIEEAGAPVDDGVDLVDDKPTIQAIQVDDESAIHRAAPVVDRDPDEAIQPAIQSDDLAARVRDSLGTDADTAVIRRAIELHGTGLSRRRIGEEVGVAHSTVGRWLKAADEIDGSGPALAVVR